MLPNFLVSLDHPLGFRQDNLNKWELYHVINVLQIRDYGGKVYFLEVLWMLAYYLQGTNLQNVKDIEAVRDVFKHFYNRSKKSPHKYRDESAFLELQEGQVTAF